MPVPIFGIIAAVGAVAPAVASIFKKDPPPAPAAPPPAPAPDYTLPIVAGLALTGLALAARR